MRRSVALGSSAQPFNKRLVHNGHERDLHVSAGKIEWKKERESPILETSRIGAELGWPKNI
jgi:hypothetical protein